MAAGCVTVPTYTTNTTRDHAHILGNSGARAVIVSNQKLAKNLIPAVLTSTECHHVIGMEEIRSGQVPDWVTCHSWKELASGDADVARAEGSRSRASGATISPASSTPAAPAERRAGSSSITARSSTMSRAAPTSSRPTSAGATRCSCPSCRRATLTSIPAGSTFPIALGARDLLRREPREARRQYRGSAADDHGRRAATVRDASRADHQVDRGERRPLEISARTAR